LNFTLLAHRNDYDRPRNLQLVCDTLNEMWGVSLKVNKKDDIICNDRWKVSISTHVSLCDGWKGVVSQVSGSAARLVRDSSFHHFTLLLDTDRHSLSSALKPHPPLTVSSSTATPSVRSEVMNLCTLHPEVTHDGVVRAVTEKFYHLHGVQDKAEVRGGGARWVCPIRTLFIHIDQVFKLNIIVSDKIFQFF